MPFVRKGLIDGVYGFSAWEVLPSWALQEMMEKMGVWVSEAEPPASGSSIISTSPYIVLAPIITIYFPGRTYRWAWAEGLVRVSVGHGLLRPFQVKHHFK